MTGPLCPLKRKLEVWGRTEKAEEIEVTICSNSILAKRKTMWLTFGSGLPTVP
jgi:hypothetical protein